MPVSRKQQPAGDLTTSNARRAVFPGDDSRNRYACNRRCIRGLKGRTFPGCHNIRFRVALWDDVRTVGW